MKVRLLAGTINHWQDDDEWRNVHLDITDRSIYDSSLNMMLRPDVVADLADELPMFENEVFDEVRCHHVLEHMTYERATLAVRAIHRVLKHDGVFDVETPDMGRVAKAWVDQAHKESDLQQWIHGEDLGGAFDGHRYSFSARSLKTLIQDAGFKIMETPETGLAVRYVAQKRFLDEEGKA